TRVSRSARSIRTTSAPISAKSMAAKGPGPIPAISRTRSPASGPVTYVPFLRFAFPSVVGLTRVTGRVRDPPRKLPGLRDPGWCRPTGSDATGAPTPYPHPDEARGGFHRLPIPDPKVLEPKESRSHRYV